MWKLSVLCVQVLPLLNTVLSKGWDISTLFLNPCYSAHLVFFMTLLAFRKQCLEVTHLLSRVSYLGNQKLGSEESLLFSSKSALWFLWFPSLSACFCCFHTPPPQRSEYFNLQTWVVNREGRIKGESWVGGLQPGLQAFKASSTSFLHSNPMPLLAFIKWPKACGFLLRRIGFLASLRNKG